MWERWKGCDFPKIGLLGMVVSQWFKHSVANSQTPLRGLLVPRLPCFSAASMRPCLHHCLWSVGRGCVMVSPLQQIQHFRLLIPQTSVILSSFCISILTLNSILCLPHALFLCIHSINMLRSPTCMRAMQTCPQCGHCSGSSRHTKNSRWIFLMQT